jgi:hypothetical protein
LKRKLSISLGSITLATAAAVFGVATPALASGQYCTASNGDFSACTDVNGAASVINWASANATSTSALIYSEDGSISDTYAHVELVNPQGDELCNGSNVTITKAGMGLSCTWQAGGKDYVAGNYCTVVWGWLPEDILGMDRWVWETVGPKNCLYVS